jgi:hypothetical protein
MEEFAYKAEQPACMLMSVMHMVAVIMIVMTVVGVIAMVVIVMIVVAVGRRGVWQRRFGA